MFLRASRAGRYSVPRTRSNAFGSTLNGVRSPPPSHARCCRARTPQPFPSSRTSAACTSHGASSTRRNESAAAPRTAAPSPNADGTTTNEPDRAASDRSSSIRRTSSTSQGESGPKHPPSTTPRRSRRLNVDASATPSQRPASASARDDVLASPSSARRTSSSVRLRRPAGRRDSRSGRDRLLPDERLDAATAPAGAEPAVHVDRHVAELAPEAMGTAEEPAAEHDAASRRRPRRRRRRSRRSRPRRPSSARRAPRGSTRSRRGRGARDAPRARPRPESRASRGSARTRRCRTPPRRARARPPRSRSGASPSRGRGVECRPSGAPEPVEHGPRRRAAIVARTSGARTAPPRSGPRARPRRSRR